MAVLQVLAFADRFVAPIFSCSMAVLQALAFADRIIALIFFLLKKLSCSSTYWLKLKNA